MFSIVVTLILPPADLASKSYPASFPRRTFRVPVKFRGCIGFAGKLPARQLPTKSGESVCARNDFGFVNARYATELSVSLSAVEL